MPVVMIHPAGKKVAVEKGKTLLDAVKQLAASEETSVEVPCGGLGLCGNCRIRVITGRMQPPTEAELEALSETELQKGYRLACQAVVTESLEVGIPPESMSSPPDLQTAGASITVAPDPIVKRYGLRLRESSLTNPKSCWQQIEHALASEHGATVSRIDAELIRRRNPLARETTVAVSVADAEVINLHTGGNPPPLAGLAVDLGTTKVAGYLVDLSSGKVLASDGVLNPQVRCGADVITRLAYAGDSPQHAGQMCRMARECINHLADTLTTRAGLKRSDIEQAVIVGNTAMQHLLLHWPTAQLCRSPFMPASTSPLLIKSRELQLDFAPGAQVYFLPSVAGFIGGDHTAMMLATRLDRSESVTLGFDIGTNTELALCCAGKIYCCSCASGPAFEGGALRHGVRAVPGAVSRVRLEADGQVRYQTIGSQPAVGVCGSGAVDAVAQLVKNNIVNSAGIMDEHHPGVRPGGEDAPVEFVLVSADKSGTGRDITLNQGDINAIQLAKAAIASATALLLSTAKLAIKDIEQVIVAGAFGSHLGLGSAISIGLFPELPRDRFAEVGNAAGTGARMALISAAERREAESLAAKVTVVELATHPEFGAVFSRSLQFPKPAAQTEFP